MKKLAEYKDEEAIELLADLLDPVATIFTEKDTVKYMREQNYVKAVATAVKGHSKEVKEIMATLEGVPVKEFHCDLLTLPKMLIDLFNDPLLQDFFTVQAQMASDMDISEKPSGSVTENTKGKEKSDTSSNT